MSRDSRSQSGMTFPSGLKDAITYTRFVITDHLYFIIQTYVRKINRENSDLAYFVRSDITYNDYVTKLAWSNTIIGTEQFFVITIAVTSAKIIPASTIIGTLPFNVVENSVPVLYQDSYIIAYGKNLRIEKEIAAGTTILAYIPTRILK